MIEIQTKIGNGNGADGASKASKKKRKKSRKRKAQPQPGDPDYKTPTQLRNARKRRKKKQDKATAGAVSATTETNSKNTSTLTPESSMKSINDPSLKYLSNPKAAPTVRNAIKFFREKTNSQAGTNHDAYFPVTLGPKLGWRTVARLAVQRKDCKGDDSEKVKRKLRIGLFVPGSHELLPVPDCPVHHRKINGLMKILEDECNSLGVPALENDAYGNSVEDSNSNFGLRHVAIAVERTTQRQQLVLVWKEPSRQQQETNILDDLTKRLVQLSKDKTKKDIRLHSIWIHYNNAWKHSNSIFDREGRWETKFVDGEAKSASEVSKDSPLHGAILETMLPLAKKAGTKKNQKNTETSSKNTNIKSDKIRVPLYFPPQVFRQANLDGFAKIILKIREWLQDQQSEVQTPNLASSNQNLTIGEDVMVSKRKRRRGKRDTSNNSLNKQQQQKQSTTLGHCLELYGGVGTIGLNLVDLFDSLDSSDENPFNEACFHASADKIQLLQNDGVDPKSSVYLDPSKRAKITYTSKSASDIVVENFDSLQQARVVVVDPPRKGLDPPVIEALCSDYGSSDQQQQQALVYVSCGFDAFRRDYRALVEKSGKWTLDRAEGHILFPGSDAIETLAFFTRTK